MSKPRKAKGPEPSLRDRLSEAFLTAFERDFQEHGIAVIEQLRVKFPERYCQVGAQLIAAAEQPASAQDFSKCESMADIGRQLLRQVGLTDVQITDAMVEQAAEANSQMVDTLERIASGH